MHEVAIAEEIKTIVLRHLAENGRKKVLKVRLVFGELTSIVPEALDFAFEAVSKGTPMEGAGVRYTIKKLKALCKKCKKNFRVRDFMYICPSCGSADVTVVSGKEMIVQTIEME